MRGRLRATAGSRERAVRVGADGAFRWAVPTRHAGKMCVRLSLTPATGYVGGVRRRCVRIATPLLRLGARGAAVRFLQQRLSRLRYALLGAGGTRSRRSKVSRATGPLTH